jgi:antitoxin component of MazEF toxin-antitoxin module
MKVQVIKNGNSKVITLPSTFVRFHGIEIGDWVDISDVKKVEREETNDNRIKTS